MKTKIRIDPEFGKLIPPADPTEFASLKASILAEGCRDPLVIWMPEGILVDGHNRFRICQEAALPFHTVERTFPDRDAVKLWIIENQLGRRNLAALDRVALAEQLEGLIAARAKENQGTRTDLVQNSAPSDPGKTRDKAAALAGVSHDTYAKGKAVLANGTPELKTAVRQGKVSINAGAKIASLPPEEQNEVVARPRAEIREEVRRVEEKRKEEGKARKEPATAEAQAAKRWSDAFRQVYRLAVKIERIGDLHRLSRGWPERERDRLAEQCREIGGWFAGWASQLEESLR